MQYLPLQALYEVLPEKNFIKNYALNRYNNEGATGNFFLFS